jgi:mono/diheme cytochrome c family protein
MSHRRFSAVAAVVSGAMLFGSMATASAAAVDEATFNGWKLYKRERCETCHGPTGEGGAAFPNLLNSLKTLTKEQFNDVVLNGRKNMPQFKENKKVVEGIDALYTYLKARSDGTVPAGDLEQAK